MNVIAKSSTIAPFAKATVEAVSVGAKPIKTASKIQRKKIALPSPLHRCLGYSLSQDLQNVQGSICVSSGISGKAFRISREDDVRFRYSIAKSLFSNINYVTIFRTVRLSRTNSCRLLYRPSPYVQMAKYRVMEKCQQQLSYF